jgi:hypothetical protein
MINAFQKNNTSKKDNKATTQRVQNARQQREL